MNLYINHQGNHYKVTKIFVSGVAPWIVKVYIEEKIFTQQTHGGPVMDNFTFTSARNILGEDLKPVAPDAKNYKDLLSAIS